MGNLTQAEIGFLIVNHTSKYFQCLFFRSNNKRRKWKKMQLPRKLTSLQKIPKNQKIELEKVVVANASIQIIPACWPFWYITQVITFYLPTWCIHFTWDTFVLERYANVFSQIICMLIKHVDSFDILPSCQAKLFLDYLQLARKRTCL